MLLTRVPLVHACLTILVCVSSSFGADFHTEVLPLLTKLGCNSGACHGAAAGRGQFALSLFGSDPAADYEAIVEAYQGRRIHLQEPEASLLLTKPSGRIAHEGGERFDPESDEAELLTSWIREGAPRGDAPILTALAISKDLRSNDETETYQIQVTASFDSTAERDVTNLVQFSWDGDPSMIWQPDLARATMVRPGRSMLVARYMNRTVPLEITKPFPRDPAHAREPVFATTWVDREILNELERFGLEPGPRVSEARWLRRATLDLTGRLPTLPQYQAFEADLRVDKRERWIDACLESDTFAEYWASRWAQALGAHPLPQEPECAAVFHAWLSHTIRDDRSWREIARSLLTSQGDTHLVGPANFARFSGDARQHAEQVARSFLGSRLQCANCHNHPLDHWTQDDYHGLAAILANVDRGRMVHFQAAGQVTHLKTLLPARPRLPGEQFLFAPGTVISDGSAVEAFTEWLLDSGNPYFARAIVNRTWSLFFGVGLVHPIDDMRATNPPTHPQLLARLVDTFRESDFRMKPLIRAILLSDAYARQAQDPLTLYGTGEEMAPSESHPSLSQQRSPSTAMSIRLLGIRPSRRMQPEVLYDALWDVVVGPADQDTPSPPRAIHVLSFPPGNETLQRMGQCPAGKTCTDEVPALGLDTQLHWIHGDYINGLLTSGTTFIDRAINAGADDTSIIKEGFLRALGRNPTPRELQFWSEKIPSEATERLQWYQDWLWGLLASSEFLYE